MESRISLIVPVYNAASTLERCVRALMEQTHQNIEIILVNDGSRDNSLELCRAFAAEDARIRVIDKPNGGVSSARNAGLDAATGEFIMFCDSDDWAEPDWCEELLSHYEEGCLVMCGHYVEGEQPYVPHEIRAEATEVYQFNEIMQLRTKFFTCPWNKIYRSATIHHNALRFNEEISNGEDYLFNLQYITKLKGHIIRLTKCVFHYVWPEGDTLSSKIPEDFFEQLQHFSQGAVAELHTLGIDEENGLCDFFSDLFCQYEKGIMHMLVSEKPLSERIRCVNQIMKTHMYRECVLRANVSTKMLYATIWRQQNCYGILLWKLISDMRRKGR